MSEPTKLRWGVLSTAKIGRKQVIPALQKSRLGEVTAIASRDLARAQQAADGLVIGRAYGSYEELLADPAVDAVYNPLPNHLHVPMSIAALEAGKHVLCEKPIALSAAEAEKLLAAGEAHPELKLMEAFMYRFHPQWERVFELIAAGTLGELREVRGWFSYFNDDPQNIRNQSDLGGGALMDIGCYPISMARFVLGREPVGVLARVERDPRFGTDRHAAAVLDFNGGAVATLSCGTQMAPGQGATIAGTAGVLRIEWPFTPPPEDSVRMWLDLDGATEEIVVGACDKYTAQADRFAEAVLNDQPVPTPLADAVANMRVIEAALRSGESGRRVAIG
ncbi:Glucose--fructose oxidoreductase precursor [Pseudobythopirellula maris]|uniref:Glucose--fructose oxidoreductase n=1 Tax=Pseudobythopirellula maris TaxID=2527991 RepID=A0A5C5ZJ95_9BACT|nr:Gfo/Idh/MocA family oxidoreductase [Pseudobythopirellula maris]TWT87195.1 Glucose--fructose oxidoreductase precursor [Pseudobythopirellula maris]